MHYNITDGSWDALLPDETIHDDLPCVTYSSSIDKMARKASCGTSISPICFMRFLPS